MTFCTKEFNGKNVIVIQDLCKCGNRSVMFIYNNEPLFVCRREWEDDVIGSNESNYIDIDEHSFIVYKELINDILKLCLDFTIKDNTVKVIKRNIITEYCVTFEKLKVFPAFLADNDLYL